jgi:hypothetical protein
MTNILAFRAIPNLGGRKTIVAILPSALGFQCGRLRGRNFRTGINIARKILHAGKRFSAVNGVLTRTSYWMCQWTFPAASNQIENVSKWVPVHGQDPIGPGFSLRSRVAVYGGQPQLRKKGLRRCLFSGRGHLAWQIPQE